MKNATIKKNYVFGFLVFVLFQLNVVAQKKVYFLVADSVSINGSSNLCKWTEKVGKIWGETLIEVKEDDSFHVLAVHINLDVASIQSNRGKLMDKKTFHALMAEEYPQLIFELSSLEKTILKAKNSNLYSSLGKLSIAGVTRPIETEVKIIANTGTTFEVEGDQEINMTLFGIKPPNALLGIIKTRKVVRIHFKLLFEEKTN